jgi:hypothetical protein
MTGRLGVGGLVHYEGARTKGVQNCTSEGKLVAASVSKRPDELVILSPVLTGMAGNSNGQVRVSANMKSLLTSKGGWTWTYTPSMTR